MARPLPAHTSPYGSGRARTQDRLSAPPSSARVENTAARPANTWLTGEWSALQQETNRRWTDGGPAHILDNLQVRSASKKQPTL